MIMMSWDRVTQSLTNALVKPALSNFMKEAEEAGSSETLTPILQTI
jgi:hypothetical protein